MKHLMLSSLFLICHMILFAQQGLDLTFGNSGFALTGVEGNNKGAVGNIITLTDGSFFTLGHIINTSATDVRKVIVKLKADGLPDSSFGKNGVFLFPEDWNKDYAFSIQSMRIQPDGDLLLSGIYRAPLSTDPFAERDQFFLMRVYADGRDIDRTLGTNGVLKTIFYSISRGITDYGDMRIQADGRIILLGKTHHPVIMYDGFGLIRLWPDGRVDSTFGENGRVFTNIGMYYNTPVSLAIMADGRILASGSGDNYPPVRELDFCVVRYLPDGTLDSQFNGMGIKYATNNNPGLGHLKYMTAQEDGKVLLIGHNTFTQSKIKVVRLLTNGGPDPGFGNNGIATIETEGRSIRRKLTLQPDGKILLGGNWGDDGVTPDEYGWEIIRLRTNGTIDPDFGAGGRIRVPENISGSTEYYHLDDVAVQEESKILVAGAKVDVATGAPYRTIARFHADGKTAVMTADRPVPVAALFYPNPSGGEIYIHPAYADSLLDITLINSLGQSRPLYPEGSSLPAGHLSPGVYWIRVLFRDQQVHTERLIVR